MTRSTTKEATGPLARRGPPRFGLILAVCCLGQLMVILDVSIVNVALPAMQKALHFDVHSLQWVFNAYLIAFAGFLLLTGRLADLFGRRRLLLSGLVVFTVASLIGGISQNAITLVLARGGMGLGAAAIASSALAVLSATFTEPAARAKAFALWGAAAGSGGAVGVLSGGAIVQWLSWRWVLLVNVPLGLLIFAMAVVAVGQAHAARTRLKLDLPGALSVTLGITGIVYGLAAGEQYGWGSARIVASFGIGAALLAFFVLDQAKLARQPLMPLGFFRNRSVSAANVLMFAVGATLPSTFYFLTLLFQRVLGYGPLHTGLVFLPLSATAFAGAALCSGLVPRVGPRTVLILGLLPMIGALGWLSQANEFSTFGADLLGPTMLFGFGLGAIVTAAAAAATAGVSEDQQGLASGLLNTNQSLGGAAGLACLVAVASARTTSVGGPSVAGGLSHHALAAGYGLGFLASGVLLVASLAAAAAVPRMQRPGTSTETAKAKAKATAKRKFA
jgi:EmrB/QacA subfamily drug resistance transporter